ncbi:MAG TPA: chloride channel protein [Bacteroidales bacterium]|mgnify:CR=1 FL=1|nr:chloride channel protein [Bacteroidales bacterium]HRX95359.1 chloride channel protein [Bacteroidales bacterium]
MKLPGIINRITIWRNRRISASQFLLILSMVVGILSGLAAVLLKNIVHYTFYLISKGFQFERENYLYLALPLIGISITVVFTKFILKKNIGHGVSRILYAISKKNGVIDLHHTWSSMVGSTFTVAFGGSVGLEAPIVLTGSAIGSNLGHIFRLNRKTLNILIGCGAAGAIAGIFKSPIAAVVFAIEVLMIDLTISALIPLLISAVAGATVAFFLSGSRVLFSFDVSDPFLIKQIPYFILLGVFTGLVSVYFTRITVFIEKLFGTIKQTYRKLIAGGLILGVLIFVFPSLFGEGYEILQEVLSGQDKDLINEGLFYSLKDHTWFLLLIMFLILVFKAVATSVTNGSGGVGGIFAPSLFMGGMAGFLAAKLLNLIPGITVSESNFALVGMAGVMSGVMHAPLTGIFLIAEITGGYALLTPLIITATISFLTIKYFEPHSIYAKRLAERGELITHHKDKAMLSMMKIDNLLETNFQTIDVNATLGDFVKVVPHSQRNVFPVVDSENNFYGIIFINDIRNIIFNREIYETTFIRDLMYMPDPLVDPNESMEDIARKFSESENYNLPVIKEGKYLGFVSRAKVFSTYRKLIEEFSDE